MLKAERNDNKNKPDYEKCISLGEAVGKLPKMTWEGTESPLYEAVMKLNPQELAMFCRYFHKNRAGNQNIAEALKQDFDEKSDAYKALHSLIFAVISPSEYCAVQFYEAMKGVGTRNENLIRLAVTRDEIDMELIKAYFKKLYAKELIDDIKSELTGDYEDLIVEICDH